MESSKKFQNKLKHVLTSNSISIIKKREEDRFPDFSLSHNQSSGSFQLALDLSPKSSEIRLVKNSYTPNSHGSFHNTREKIKTKIKRLTTSYSNEIKIEPVFKLSPLKLKTEEDYHEKKVEEVLNKTQRSFRIRDSTFLKTPTSRKKFLSPLSRSGTFFFTEPGEFERPSMMLSDAFLKTEAAIKEEEDDVITVDPNDPDFFEKMKLIYFTNASHSDLELQARSPLIPKAIDRIMKEPYTMIKIKNLYNFKAQPLEIFDPELFKEDPKYLKRKEKTDGYSRYMTEKGKFEWRSCEVLKYDEHEKMFQIKWKHDNSLKKVTRLNLKFMTDKESNFEERIKQALENRYKSLYLQTYDEMLEQRSMMMVDELKYPEQSLKNITSMAHKGFENLDKLTLPKILIDETLINYRKNILKFQLECYNYKNQDHLNRMQKAKLKLRKKPRRIYFSKADEAYEIIDVRAIDVLKHFTKHQLEIFGHYEHEVYDHSEEDANHNFYKIQAQSYSIASGWTPESIVSFMERIDFKDMTIFKEDESSYEVAEIYLNSAGTPKTKRSEPTKAMTTRIETRRIVFLINTMEANDKDTTSIFGSNPGNEGNSVKIQAFCREISKLLIKPSEVVNEIFIKIMNILSQIGETRVFKDFSKVANRKILKHSKDLQLIILSVQNESESYQHHCYRIEDQIVDLDEKLVNIKCENVEDTVKKSLRFVNTLIQSYVKYSFQESLKELVDSWERYSCVLPLPYINQDIVNYLPEFIYRQRKESRKKFYMEEEKFEYKNALDAYFMDTEEPQTVIMQKIDRTIISKLVALMLHEIHTKKRNNMFYRDSYKNYSNQRIKPLFNIRYMVKQGINLKKAKSMTSEERLGIISTCRQRIIDPYSFGDTLVDQKSPNEVKNLKATKPEDFVRNFFFLIPS